MWEKDGKRKLVNVPGLDSHHLYLMGRYLHVPFSRIIDRKIDR
jgi:hypothetical protein